MKELAKEMVVTFRHEDLIELFKRVERLERKLEQVELELARMKQSERRK